MLFDNCIIARQKDAQTAMHEQLSATKEGLGLVREITVEIWMKLPCVCPLAKCSLSVAGMY
jgi:hypothetical protein